MNGMRVSFLADLHAKLHRKAVRMKAAGADAFDVLTTVSWEDRSWWNGALNRGSVLDYFANSQFFDRASVNAQLRMQGSMLPPEVAREQLARLPGIVFELDETRLEELPPTASDPAAHSLYVIRKLRRAPSGAETTLRYYYVMDGVVYEAPTLWAVVQARLRRLGWYLSEAFEAARAAANGGDGAMDATEAVPAKRGSGRRATPIGAGAGADFGSSGGLPPSKRHRP